MSAQTRLHPAVNAI